MSLRSSRLQPIKPLSGLTTQLTPTAVCANCGNTASKLLACSKCRAVHYCGKECQISHWTQGHKSQCGKYHCHLCHDLDPIAVSLDHILDCSHHVHKLCLESFKTWGVLEHICPVCRPPLEESPEQLFEVAARRLFILERRAARGDTAWDALAESEDQDMTEIISIFQRTSGDGLGKASCSLGLLYYLGHGVPQDDSEAVKWWTLASEQNDGRSCYNLGAMYKDGRGVVKDVQEFVRWTLKAATFGTVEAMNNLGTMYEHGDGLEQNDVEAFSWTRKAAEAGYAPAQLHLASMLLTGTCTTADVDAGARWLEIVAANGDVDGQLQLASLHESGQIAEASDETAVRWYTAAADQGSVEGLFKLGCLFIQNKGMAKSIGTKKKTNNWLVLSEDLSEQNRIANALACFVLAGSRGHELSQQLVEELRPKVSSGDVVPLPSFSLDSDPAAVVAAIATASAEAAQKATKEKKANKQKKGKKK